MLPQPGALRNPPGARIVAHFSERWVERRLYEPIFLARQPLSLGS